MIYHDYTETSTPSVYPVTRDEAKDWLRVDDTNSDDLIDSLIESATYLIEQMVNRPLISRTYTLKMDCFPSVIELSKVPCTAVSQITYLDSQGSSQTLATSVYRTSLGGEWQSCRITRDYGQVWPATYPVVDAVTVSFTAGYGAAGSDVPEAIRQAILYQISSMFDSRCPTDSETFESPTSKALVKSRMWPRDL